MSRGTPFNGMEKGWPALDVAEGERGYGDLVEGDLPTPVLVLRTDILDANIAAMQRWCDDRSVALAPHGKTTMAPAIFRRQLAAGAWGLTVVDVRQARVAVQAGAQRVLIANQVVTTQGSAGMAALRAAGVDVRCWVDSAVGIEVLADAGRRSGCPLSVVLERGYAGGRTGSRSDDTVRELADAVVAEPWLRLAGVSAYEGLLGVHDGSGADRVGSFLADVAATVEAVSDRWECDEPVVTAGGSAYFDSVVAELGDAAAAAGATLVLRSGCYVTHDHGTYASARAGREPHLTAALHVRTTVLSRPEPRRVILDAGRRDLGEDAGRPVVLDRPGEVVALNDQHAHVVLDEDRAVNVGEGLRLGISHPCTTLDKWRVFPAVDAEGRVVEAIETRF